MEGGGWEGWLEVDGGGWGWRDVGGRGDRWMSHGMPISLLVSVFVQKLLSLISHFFLSVMAVPPQIL